MLARSRSLTACTLFNPIAIRCSHAADYLCRLPKDASDPFHDYCPLGWKGAYSGPRHLIFVSPQQTGFNTRHYDWSIAPGHTSTRVLVTLPRWVLMLLAAVLPALWMTRWLRRGSLSRQGPCATCGDDLRASPERCPECGTVKQLVVPS